MDEEKKVNEREVDFDEASEPIDTIEKTVADLKKKIQHLTDEAEEELDIPNFANRSEEKVEEIKEELDTAGDDFREETKETVEEVKEEAKEFVEEAKEKAQEAVETIKTEVENNEQLQKTVSYIKDNAVKAADVAKNKVDEIRKDPKFQAVEEKAANAFQSVSKTVGESTKTIVQKVDTFVNRPDVQDKIYKARITVADVAKKGTKTIKGLFKKDEE